MYLAMASFLNTSGKGDVDHEQYKVRNELLSSGDFGQSWQRLAPMQAFIPWGSESAFDSHGDVHGCASYMSRGVVSCVCV